MIISVYDSCAIFGIWLHHGAYPCQQDTLPTRTHTHTRSLAACANSAVSMTTTIWSLAWTVVAHGLLYPTTIENYMKEGILTVWKCVLEVPGDVANHREYICACSGLIVKLIEAWLSVWTHISQLIWKLETPNLAWRLLFTICRKT